MIETGENIPVTGLEIAVIGMACRFPGADDIDEFWDNLQKGIESISFFSDQELEESRVSPAVVEESNYVKAKGILKDIEYFDASFFGYTPAEATMINPQLRILHECVWQALENAGYSPKTYSGLIGLYAGESSGLFWEGLILSSGIGDTADIDPFSTRLFITKDALATSISYRLDLKGPSFTVQTACSTSLVAIHLACQGLLSGDCDIALAGGVSIDLPNKVGYTYREGMIVSPDGHCRALDARARGTVFGNGVGIVTLKPLEDAVVDRDNIYAVIKGTAINNDGARKVGFTAPSTRGQAEVIRAAVNAAKIPVESIGYVETHGTGTGVGDPIEMEALQIAFNTDRKQFCAVGSVKTNIGHLDVAAGVASFVKTVLALDHKKIPASLHFEQPNPKINFENSPFYVNTELSEWQTPMGNGYPLRAGVSSFGIGGTNAHVILEEPPGICRNANSSPSQQPGLLLLSAKTESALNSMTENLVDYLKVNPDINFADMIYTLQVGRSPFLYRKKLLCADAGEAIEDLSSPGSPRVHTSIARDDDRPVVFMFTGQGGQYLNMGLGLYQAEPVFRQEMDRCFDILRPLMGFDIQEVLYPDLSRPAAHKPVGEGELPVYDGEGINRTECAQPLLFALEYALARLMMKWGINPYAMIGHSIGEYVAACLAGIFSLEEALAVVASRGKLMQSLPTGSMLSVPISEGELKPLLNSEIDLAAVNSTSHCVVSGSHETIEAFTRQLKQKGYDSRPLFTSHAFHSKMMEPILQEFEQKVRQVTLNKPGLPFISNVTGRWITDEEALDPRYWTRHIRRTVRFKDGLSKLLEEENVVFLELGPGRSLSTFVKQHGDKKPGQQVINLIRHPREEVTDTYYLLDKIGHLWLYGKTIDWGRFYGEEKRYRIPLPPYPFERQRYWIEGNPFDGIGQERLPKESRLRKKADIEDWFYFPCWKQSVLIEQESRESPGSPDESTQTSWLVFMDTEGVADRLVERLEQQGQRTVGVKMGPGFYKTDDQAYAYTISPSQENDYVKLFEELRRGNNLPQRIVYLWNISTNRKNGGEFEYMKRARETGYLSLIYIAKAIKKSGITNNIQIGVVTNNMQKVVGETVLYPEKAIVLGPVTVIPQEYPHIRCWSLDFAFPGTGLPQPSNYVDQILAEFSGALPHREIAYRDHQRWVQTMEPIPRHKPAKTVSRLRERGVYLITGAFGRIGFILAEYLAKRVKAKLILTGRSPLPPREEWRQWLANHPEENRVSRALTKIKELEELGAEVLAIQADVADYEQMKRGIARAEKNFGQVNGIIHAAGALSGEALVPIEQMSRSVYDRQFQAKGYGILVLEKIFHNRNLDFCLLMSSLSSILGGLGYAAYSSANIFMDAFVQNHNRSDSGRWLSVNWDSWQTWGEEESTTAGDKTRFEMSMTPEEGIKAFQAVLSLVKPGRFDRLVVSTADLQTRIDQWVHLEPGGEEENLDRKHMIPVQARPNLATPYVPPKNNTEHSLARIWQHLLGLKQVGVEDDFFELGGDSLKAVTIASRIHQQLDVEVPLPEIFSKTTIRGLAEYINNTRKSRYSPIGWAEEKEYYPLSSAQKRLFILQQMETDNMNYNLPLVVELEGTVERERLESTFYRLIKRHESLRSSFKIIDDQAVQIIHSKVDFEIETHDIHDLTVDGVRGTVDGRGGPLWPPVTQPVPPSAGHPSPAAPTAQSIHKGIIGDFIRPFDLSRAPLLRVGLIHTSLQEGHFQERYILMVDMHHIVSDGTSQNILIKEFAALYEGQELAPLSVQYRDYSEWQNQENTRISVQKQEAHWLKQFESEIPILDLPTDYTRPAVQRFEGNSRIFSIGKPETQNLKEISIEEEATLYMILLAGLYVLLSKLSGQEDIVIGSPTAGRRHSDLEQTIGMFVNTLALRNYPSREKPFREFLRELKKRTLEAFENQSYQFEDLVERVEVRRDMSRNPLFDVMFIFQNFDVQPGTVPVAEMTGLKIKPYEYQGEGTSKFDLTLTGMEILEENNLLFNLEYCTNLFKESTVERFIHYFKKIITSILENPDVKLYEIEIISGEEKRQLLRDFNDTAVKYPRDKTIHELIEAQVQNRGDKVALVFEDRQLTYHQLDRRANQLAGVLQERGVQAASIVGLLVPRSLEMMVGLLGILKGGGAYLPLDPQYPVDRINYILEKSSTAILVTRGDLIDTLAEVKPGCPILDLFDERLYRKNTSRLKKGDSPPKLAYVIYTSGSTGNPKGVAVEHQNLINFIEGMRVKIDFSAHKTILALTTISFDIFALETILPLASGLRVVIANEDQQIDPLLLENLIVKGNIDMLQVTPSRLQLLFDNGDNRGYLQGIEELMVGGEAFPDRLFESVKECFSGRIYNLYGPTETTVWSCIKDLTDMETINIGSPIANTQVYILGRHHSLQPVGIAGELCIGGDGVGRGYLNNPGLTGEKFIHISSPLGQDNVLSPEDSPVAHDQCRMTTLYRTGDLARWLPDGNIEFLGRSDHQVKIRGFRIELEEIEELLLSHESIKEAVVLPGVDESDGKYLAAYIVPDSTTSWGEGNLETTVLREYLSLKLPDYMIPAYFVPLERFPLTPNGKIDRKAMPEPEARGAGSEYVAPRDQVEEKLTRLWQEILGVERIGIQDNFFLLGGHSLRATILVSRIRGEFNVEFPLSRVFSGPTIRTMGENIKNLRGNIYEEIKPVEKREYYPQSSAQKRLLFLEQFEDTGTNYNIPFVMRIKGALEKKPLENAFKALIERQETLRTSFELIGTEPVQRIHDKVDFKIQNIQVDEKDIEKTIRDFIRPFDLSRAPLFRVGLLSSAEEEYILIFDIHHIIADGTSIGIFAHQLTKLYEKEELPPLEIQYRDFALWQNRLFESDKMKEQERYWLDLYSGEILRLNLAVDFPRPQLFNYEGDTYEFNLGKEDSVHFKELGSRNEVTLFMNLLAAFNVLIYRYTDQDDIVVGSVVAGRPSALLQDIIGMFVNTLAFKNHLEGEMSYLELLKVVRENTVAAFDNQDVQFEDLINKLDLQKDPSRNPLFDVSLVVQNFDRPTIHIKDVTFAPHESVHITSKFDMTLFVYDIEDELYFSLEYATALFKRATIEKFSRRYIEILKQVTENPGIKLKDIKISYGLLDARPDIHQDDGGDFEF